MIFHKINLLSNELNYIEILITTNCWIILKLKGEETKKMKNFILCCILVLACCFVSFGQATIIFDPTKKSVPNKASAAEKSLVEKQALPSARKRWKNNEACAESFEIISDATGSFTKKNAKQRAVLYEFCQTGNGWSNGGIILFEAGKIIAHYVFDSGGWEFDLDALPDINRNGFEELQ